MPTTPTNDTVASTGVIDDSLVTCSGTCNDPTSEPEARMLARHGLVKVKGDVFRRETASRSKGAIRQARRRELLQSTGVRDVTLPVPEEHVARLRAIMKELVSHGADEPMMLFAVPARLAKLVDCLSHVEAKDPVRAIAELEFEFLKIEELADRIRQKAESEKGLRLLNVTGWRGKIVQWISSGLELDEKSRRFIAELAAVSK